MFYTFSQNNTGGSFEVNGQVSHYVIIEAKSADEANWRASDRADIYFDGCDAHMDCPCCGDRWYTSEESEGTEHPEIYGEDIATFREKKDGFGMGWKGVIVYYDDGTKEIHSPSEG